MLTVRAERVARNGDWEMLATERPRGVFSRQLVLGDNLDLERIEAGYKAGVLRLVVPVAEKAKPRKIEIDTIDHRTDCPCSPGHRRLREAPRLARWGPSPQGPRWAPAKARRAPPAPRSRVAAATASWVKSGWA